MNQRNKGMTFVEVLIGLTITALLVVGASTFLYSLTRTYFNLENGPVLDRHADGVVRFLNYLADTSEGIDGSRPNTYGWGAPPQSEEPTLAFRINQENPFFVDERKPLPPLNAYLHYDRENTRLWLVWHVDPRFTNNRVVLKYSLISPWVEGISYGYYSEEENKWEFENIGDEGRARKNEKPGQVALHFNRGGSEVRRGLNLYVPPSHVLTY